MSVIHVDFKKRLLIDSPTSVEKSPMGSTNKVENDWYAELCSRIHDRFNGNVPSHFTHCMRSLRSQPYMYGDVHDALYDTLRPELFNSPMPVPCEVTIDSCARMSGILTLGLKCKNGTDEAFQWMDLKYHCTLNFLKSLPDGTELNIFTRSDLVAHDDYIRELERLKVTVKMIYASDNDHLNRLNEPGAPSYKRRLLAVERLNEKAISASMLKHKVNGSYLRSACCK